MTAMAEERFELGDLWYLPEFDRVYQIVGVSKDEYLYVLCPDDDISENLSADGTANVGIGLFSKDVLSKGLMVGNVITTAMEHF